MRILHLGDLHIGRRFHDVSLLEDQNYILGKIVQSIEEENIEVLIIAGDIYDKTNPSESAFDLWDTFLTEVSNMQIHVIVISGNHDSQLRLGFGSEIFKKHNIHIIASLDKDLSPIEIENFRFYPIPFIRPSMVRNVFELYQGTTYEDAYQFILDTIGPLDDSYVNIAVVHQYFIYNNEVALSDSETLSLGGTDAINITLLKDFDYVAAGHIHRSQQIGLPTRRYSGSLLKYSFSESHYDKKFPILEWIEGEFHNQYLQLTPKHDVRVLEGPFEALMQMDATDDYVKVVLTDHTEIHNAIGRLKTVYPNLLTIENQSVLNATHAQASLESIQKLNPIELIHDFFARQNQVELTKDQSDDIQQTLENLEEHQ